MNGCEAVWMCKCDDVWINGCEDVMNTVTSQHDPVHDVLHEISYLAWNTIIVKL